MIRTADLTGAQLDYYTARAQGIPAERLEIRRVPRTDTLICVELGSNEFIRHGSRAYSPSTNWNLAGALLEKLHIMLESNMGGEWAADIFPPERIQWLRCTGPTPQVAICRAVVRAAFGDEVEEVAVCE